jgi:hypothetical protein
MGPIVTTSDIKVKLQEIDKQVSKIAERDTALFNQFFQRSAVVKQEELEWTEKNLVGLKDEVVQNVTTAGATSLHVKSSETYGFRRYVAESDTRTVLYINVGGRIEYMQVTAINQQADKAILTVVRGHQGTTALTSIPKGTEVNILGSPTTEGSLVEGDQSQLSVKKSNFIQTFTFPIVMTRRMQQVEQVGMDNSIDKQLLDGVTEIKKLMQKTLIYGRKWTNGATGEGRITTTGGIAHFAELNGNQKDQGGNRLGIDIINPILEQILDAGGDASGLTLLLGFKQQAIMNELKENRIIGGGMSQKEKGLNNYVESYNFNDSAMVKLQYSKDVGNNEVFIFDANKVSMHPMLGTDGQWLEYDDQGKKGLKDARFVAADMGVKIKNARETMFHLVNLSNGEGAA